MVANMQTVVIENRGANIIGSPVGLRLVPGENDVPEDKWQAFKSAPHGLCQKLLKTKQIRERTDLKSATPLIEKLSEVADEMKAVAIVEQTKSVDLLKKWANNDGRGRVQKAIMDRLTVLAVPTLQPEAQPVGQQNQQQKKH
jgi:hypothetical protein